MIHPAKSPMPILLRGNLYIVGMFLRRVGPSVSWSRYKLTPTAYAIDVFENIATSVIYVRPSAVVHVVQANAY